MEKKMNYEAAFAELQEIAAAIEDESVPVDILAEKVKRASYLIQFCQKKLRSTEEEVNAIIRQMEIKTQDPE